MVCSNPLPVDGAYDMKLRRTVQDLGLQIQKLTHLFNNLQSEVFEATEQTEQLLTDEKEQPPKAMQGDKTDNASPCLLEAIMSGSSDDARHALEYGDADPNETFLDISVRNKQFATATPLVVAALLEQRSMVRMLVAAGASVESTYSFIAGAEQGIWSGTVVHTAIPAGNLELLKDLAQLKADMNTRGSNGASLVWQACYFGQLSIMEHLLSMGLSVEQRAQSQDDSVVSYSPLHVAVTQGHVEIVQALLSAQAQITVQDGRGRTPLDDAVKDGHADIVHQLILKKGNIFLQTPVKQDDLRHMRTIDTDNRQHLSCFDRMILTEDPVLLSRVTQALAHAPSLLDQMSKHKLLQILASPGEAPIHIMNALFQKQRIWYWEVQDGKTFRKRRTQAMVSTALRMNVAQGPHAGYLMQLFGNKKPLLDDLPEFMNKLFPLVRTTEGDQMYVPVTAYMCHLPKVHNDLQILMALVDCPNKEVFHCAGVSAIVFWAWNKVRGMSRFCMCLAVVELINFMIINVFLDETVEEHTKLADGPIVLINGIVSAAIWLVALVIEAMQFLGYWSNNLKWRYCGSPANWLDLLVLIFTGYFIVVFLTPGMQLSSEDGLFPTSLGVLLFLKWFRMLVYLQQFEAIAVHTLPITSTMWDVGPFFGVMAVYLFASVNLFYALRNDYGLEECFMLIYRLVVLSDFDLAELEHKTKEPTSTPYFHVVRIMLVGVSFLIGVTMMNLFVAILCVAYDDAARKAQLAFMESRASFVLDAQAIRRGFRRVRLWCRWNHSEGGEEMGEAEKPETPFEAVGIDTPQTLTTPTTPTSPTTPRYAWSEDTGNDIGQSIKTLTLTATDIMQSDPSNCTFLWYVQPTSSKG